MGRCHSAIPPDFSAPGGQALRKPDAKIVQHFTPCIQAPGSVLRMQLWCHAHADVARARHATRTLRRLNSEPATGCPRTLMAASAL
jgi:hypothetical protein